MTAVAAKKTAARKTATPKEAAPVASDVVVLETVATATQTASETVPAVVVDPDVYVAPTGLSDGFEGNGSVTLVRKLSKRALANLTELAREGNTEQSRKYWTARLAEYGVMLTSVAVPATVEPVSA